jgi:hypothetical protein
MKQTLLLLALAAITLPSCRFAFGKRVSGNGNVTKQERSVGNFTGVSSHGPYDVYVTQDSACKIVLEGEDNLLPYIETYVENGELKVRTKEGYWLRHHRAISIHVSAPSYSAIRTVGSGNIITEKKLNNSGAIQLESTGSGDIKVQIDAPQVKAEVTGSGTINLEGETKNFNGQITGSGDIRAYDMKSENADVEILGSGNANVFASVKLNVEVNGSGDVKYKGPAQVSSNIHGSGSVKKVD